MKRGWCPSLSAPMQARDGWIVRLKPFAGVLRADQAALIADLAAHEGNGRIELTSRGNVQLRGVRNPEAVARRARAAGIAPDDPASDRLNLLVSPLAGLDPDCAPDTLAMARDLADRAGTILPILPDKFGFAVDGGGRAPVTGDAVLRWQDGAWTADGAVAADPVGSLIARVRARLEIDVQARALGVTGEITSGAGLDGAERGPRRGAACAPLLGPVPGGFVVGFAFGALDAAQWRTTIAGGDEIRVTPWRALVRVGSGIPDVPDAITQADDPRLRINACVGQAGCVKADADVRRDACALAAFVPRGAVLHVSGCAKGCASPAAASFVVVAGERGYGLVTNGRAGDAPERWVRDENELRAWLEGTGGSG